MIPKVNVRRNLCERDIRYFVMGRRVIQCFQSTEFYRICIPGNPRWVCARRPHRWVYHDYVPGNPRWVCARRPHRWVYHDYVPVNPQWVCVRRPHSWVHVHCSGKPWVGLCLAGISRSCSKKVTVDLCSMTPPGGLMPKRSWVNVCIFYSFRILPRNDVLYRNSKPASPFYRIQVHVSRGFN